MNLEKHKKIFDNISFIYNRFFSYQIKSIDQVMEKHIDKLGLPMGAKVLEIGCGTGAYCHVFKQRGYDVTGIDLSPGMLKHAIHRGLNCQLGNVVDHLDFEDNSFDLVIAAYVAHGLDREKRKKLYEESSRLSRGKVLISDYNSRKRPHISFIEFLEDGDYFNFIKTGLTEMEEQFHSVTVIPVTPSNNWYICSSI